MPDLKELEAVCQRESTRYALLSWRFVREYYRCPTRYAGFRRLVSMLESCAEVCQLGANLIAQGIGMGAGTSQATADICDHCANLCERVESREAVVDELISACRTVARSYRRLAF